MRMGHSFHLVSTSAWPITSSISILSLLLGNIMLYHNKMYGIEIVIGSLISLIYSIYYWFKDITIEGTYKGDHTIKVQKGLNLGFILFVVSEIAVFFGLFFAFFYNSLIPSVEVGSIFPPIGITTLDYKAVPLLNTLILLSSGFSITACHNYILNRDYNKSIFYLIFTILLGLLFIYFQYIEYYSATFTITDSVFGSSFFILTGCHGMHIIVGTTFLIFTLFRFSHFTNLHHLQFSSAAIYWHFLDAVWLLLYFILYCWAY